MAIAPHPDKADVRPADGESDEQDQRRRDRIGGLIAFLLFAGIIALVILLSILGGGSGTDIKMDYYMP